MPRLEDPTHFPDIAFGYYMTGRFAFFNKLDIAPNLVRLAIELMVKFTLVQDLPRQQQSDATEQLRRKYGHRLNALWGQYKQHVSPVDVSRFDQAITELAKWEDVRYGEFPEADASIAKSFAMERMQVNSSKGREVRSFGMREIDDLFSVMLATARINPLGLGTRYQSTALPEWYGRENQHIIADLFE
jgi:hypothetical protein